MVNPIFEMIASEFGSTGAVSTGWFHALLAGNSVRALSGAFNPFAPTAGGVGGEMGGVTGGTTATVVDRTMTARLTEPADTTTDVVPGSNVFTTPASVTVATAALSDRYVTGRPAIMELSEARSTTLNCVDTPHATDTESGDTNKAAMISLD